MVSVRWELMHWKLILLSLLKKASLPELLISLLLLIILNWDVLGYIT